MLKSLFLFIDKDYSQLKAIESVFNICGSFFLWDLKRTVLTKTNRLKKENSMITENVTYVVMKMMERHFHQHPSITPELWGKNLIEIRNMYINEVNDLLRGDSLATLKS